MAEKRRMDAKRKTNMKARKEIIFLNKRCQCEDWQAVDEKRRMGGRRKTNTEARKKII